MCWIDELDICQCVIGAVMAKYAVVQFVIDGSVAVVCCL